MQQQVKISQFQNAIIGKAYEKFCNAGHPIAINMIELTELAKVHDIETIDIDSQVRQLIDWGLLEYGDTFSYHATWTTLDTYERNYPGELVYANNKVRRLIIELAYSARNNATGYVDSDVVYADDRAKEFTQNAIYSGVWWLTEAGHAKSSLQSGMGFMCRLTDYGLATDGLKRAEVYPISANESVSLAAVCEVVASWIPRQKRRVEESYKAELSEYLRSHGYPKTREEEGSSNPDILVEESLPIEMKKDPDQGELDRMSGQMLRMKAEFGLVIACIVQSGPSLDRIDRFKKTWENDEQVRVIVKNA